jgi:hypothetical protein
MRHDPVAVAMPAMNTGAVAREAVAQALGRHALVEDGEVHRVERRIAQPRQHRGHEQPRVAARRARRQPRQREARQRAEQHRPRAHAVHQEARQRLPHARNHEEHRYQQPQLRIAEAELRDQEREQRRQQHVEEVRRAVGQPDQADGARILAQRRGGVVHGA